MREPRKVPVVLSPEEVARFLEAAPSIKYKVALSVAYGVETRRRMTPRFSTFNRLTCLRFLGAGRGHDRRRS